MTEENNNDAVLANDDDAIIADDEATEFTADLKRYLELYIVMNGDVVLGLIKQNDWTVYMTKHQFELIQCHWAYRKSDFLCHVKKNSFSN